MRLLATASFQIVGENRIKVLISLIWIGIPDLAD